MNFTQFATSHPWFMLVATLSVATWLMLAFVCWRCWRFVAKWIADERESGKKFDAFMEKAVAKDGGLEWAFGKKKEKP